MLAQLLVKLCVFHLCYATATSAISCHDKCTIKSHKSCQVLVMNLHDEITCTALCHATQCIAWYKRVTSVMLSSEAGCCCGCQSVPIALAAIHVQKLSTVLLVKDICAKPNCCVLPCSKAQQCGASKTTLWQHPIQPMLFTATFPLHLQQLQSVYPQPQQCPQQMLPPQNQTHQIQMAEHQSHPDPRQQQSVSSQRALKLWSKRNEKLMMGRLRLAIAKVQGLMQVVKKGAWQRVA